MVRQVNHKQVAKSVVQKLNSLLQDSEFHDELIKDASYIIAGSKRPPLSGSSNVSLGRAVSLASSGRTPIRMTSFTIQNLEKKVICLRRLITALSEWVRYDSSCRFLCLTDQGMGMDQTITTTMTML